METTERLGFLSDLYRTHADDLSAVITQQRAFLIGSPSVTPQLDDVDLSDGGAVPAAGGRPPCGWYPL